MPTRTSPLVLLNNDEPTKSLQLSKTTYPVCKWLWRSVSSERKKKSFKDDVQQAQDCIYGPTIKQQPTAASHQAHVWCSAQGACSIRRPPEHLEKPQHGSPHTRLHSIPRCLASPTFPFSRHPLCSSPAARREDGEAVDPAGGQPGRHEPGERRASRLRSRC